jgi:signal transduction histidine kinase/predicted negative regulator of RcsB-dependent stress response
MKVHFYTSIFLFSFIFSSTNSVGFYSTNPDSLETVLNSGIDIEQKIKARNNLAEYNFKYNVKKSISYLTENLNSSKIDDFPKLKASSLYLMGRAHLLIADFDKAESYLNHAQEYFSKNKLYKKVGDCLKDLGTIQLHQNNYQEAKQFYLKGIEVYNKADYKPGFAHCNLNLGNVYIEQFYYTEGIQYYYNALKIYEELKLHRYTGMANNNIGNIYKENQNYQKAYEHYEKASQSYQLDKDSLQIINVNLNIGSTFLDQNNYKQAIKILYKALEEAKSTGFNHPLPIIYNNITACHISLGNLDLAEQNNKLAMESALANKSKSEFMNSKLLAAEMNLHKKDYRESIQLAHIVYNTALNSKQLIMLSNASKILYTSFKAIDEFETSLSYLELHKSYRDSLFSENRIKIPLSKDFEYQLEKQRQSQIIQQEKDKLAWEAELSFQRMMLIFLVIGFLVLGLFVIIMYKNFKAKRIAEGELEKKNAILEKYIESNIQLEQFAHIASHDLKSPLRTVGSFSSLLKRRAKEKLNTNELEYLDMISNAAKLMWNLVDDLMTYSQVNSLQMNLAPNNANQLVEEVLANLDFSIKENNAQINVLNLPEKFMVDETKVRQVFQNLISNSLKFMPPDTTPKINIDCVSENGFWKFSVQDNGIGIPAEYHDKVFKPYKQLHTKDKFEGTGMGLAICKKIVEKHGGDISFESKIGKGTTFYFTILSTLEQEENKELLAEVAA